MTLIDLAVDTCAHAVQGFNSKMTHDDISDMLSESLLEIQAMRERAITIILMGNNAHVIIENNIPFFGVVERNEFSFSWEKI